MVSGSRVVVSVVGGSHVVGGSRVVVCGEW